MHHAQLAEALGSCSCGLAALSLIMQHCLMVDLCSDLRQDKGKILACPLSHLIRARLHHQRIWQRDWLSLCLSLWRANKASSSLQPMGRATRLDKDKRRAVQEGISIFASACMLSAVRFWLTKFEWTQVMTLIYAMLRQCILALQLSFSCGQTSSVNPKVTLHGSGIKARLLVVCIVASQRHWAACL